MSQFSALPAASAPCFHSEDEEAAGTNASPCSNATLFRHVDGCGKEGMAITLAGLIVVCALLAVLVRAIATRAVGSHRRVLRDNFESLPRGRCDEKRALLLPL